MFYFSQFFLLAILLLFSEDGFDQPHQGYGEPSVKNQIAGFILATSYLKGIVQLFPY